MRGGAWPHRRRKSAAYALPLRRADSLGLALHGRLYRERALQQSAGLRTPWPPRLSTWV